MELSSHDYLVINAGTLFTGADLKVKKSVRIHIWDGKVQFIEEKPFSYYERIQQTGKKKCQVIGGDHLTVIPGMIDCHVHLALDGEEKSLHFKDRLKDKMASNLTHGIAAVRDGGDKDGIGLACRDLVNQMELKGPVIMASGKALHKNGAYGSFLGPGVAPGELSKVLKRCIKDGINQVKVIVSGIVSFKEYRKVGKIQFDLEELEYIVRAAGEQGLKVMAHASSDEAVQLCIRAGVHSIEHGYFISEESLQKMAEREIAWVPTVVPVAVQNKRKLDRSTADADVIERTYRRQLRMVKLAQQLGVRLGVGTDAGAAGVQHGAAFLQELKLFQEAGLTPEEILMAATRNGAYIVGLEKDLGIIAPGRPAFLAALDSDLFSDLGQLSQIRYIIRPEQRMFAKSSFQTA